MPINNATAIISDGATRLLAVALIQCLRKCEHVMGWKEGVGEGWKEYTSYC